MVRAHRAIAAALLLSWVFAASPAAAQDEEARRLFLQGRELAAEGDWEAALTRWRASFVLVPRASTAVSLAHAYVRLERYAEAMSSLDDLERLADPEADADLLASGAELRAQIEVELAPAEPEPETAPMEPSEPEPAPPSPAPSGGFDIDSLAGPIGLGAAALLAFGLQGGFFAVSRDAVTRRDTLCPDPDMCSAAQTRMEAEAANQEAYDMTTAANAMLITGLALGAGAVAWLIVVLTASGDDERAAARWLTEGARF